MRSLFMSSSARPRCALAPRACPINPEARLSAEVAFYGKLPEASKGMDTRKKDQGDRPFFRLAVERIQQVIRKGGCKIAAHGSSS